MRIAIVDDEPDILQYVENIVKKLDYVPVPFNDGDRFTTAMLRDTFDLVMLDWNLPGKDGLEILEWMQTGVDDRPPVIMMTSRTAKKDIADALNAGADDYVTKPEDEGVIEARINAMLRRSSGGGAMEKTAQYGDYTLDRMGQSVNLHGEDIALTAKEFDLIDLLFRNRDRTLSRAYIMETIWRTNADLATRTLDMHVSRLRSKLKLKPENGFRISTVFGYGYRLETLEKLKG
ncbi:response regulator transcription factor [Sphingorhabdus sp. Alg239-R122]|uniref:response regulator transcription factor n=1 Tax=Sphingorhabdus sp. Alg239-R122 TaxID=2305989 RepID=UPI0013DB7D1F|nr:response regulator transcription factor [Sphingorhabdus sp. Alg239-R122]